MGVGTAGRHMITVMCGFFLFPFLTVRGQSVSASETDYDSDTIRQIITEDISVISRKEGSQIREIPSASSYVSSRDLKLNTLTGIKEFSLIVPNMFMPDYGTKLTSPVYIRGVGSRINSPSVGLYVDGIPFFEKSSFDFDFSEIDHIEVLRGPQGTLYGRNTMGGIINVSTKSPLTHDGTGLQVSYGNYDQIRASVSHYGRFNDRFGYAVSGNYEHNGGFFRNEYDGSRADRLNSGGGRVRLRYRNNGWDVNLISNFEYSDQSGYPYCLYDPETGIVEPVNYNRTSFYRRRLASNGLLLNRTGRNLMFTSRTSHQYSSDHQGIDQDFSPRNLYYINQKETQNMISQEIELRNAETRRVSWIGGVFGFYQAFDSEVAMEYGQEAVPDEFTTDKFYRSPRYGFAVYGQATYNNLFCKGLSLTAGVRYDQEYAETSFDYYRIAAGETSLVDRFESRLSHNQVTPKISLQYRLPRTALFYATVTKGYKAGGFNTSFETVEERTFKPEYSWNYEAGVKLNFWNNRLTADLACFYIDWFDQQVYQPLSTGKGSLLKNAARSVSKGVEFSAVWNIVSTLNLRTDYGYTHAVFKKYTSGETDYSGHYLPYVPRNTLSVRLDYVFSNIRCKYYDRILFSLQYTGLGRFYWNDANSAVQNFYNTLNGRISIMKGRYTLSAWFKNITNTRYSAFYFEALGNSYIQKGRPFTVGAELSLTI